MLTPEPGHMIQESLTKRRCEIRIESLTKRRCGIRIGKRHSNRPSTGQLDPVSQGNVSVIPALSKHKELFVILEPTHIRTLSFLRSVLSYAGSSVHGCTSPTARRSKRSLSPTFRRQQAANISNYQTKLLHDK
jgi:hypothetical protein